jgi:hypothetical protein
MKPGDLFIVRRGIGHRVIGSKNFRRMVIYSKQPWKLLIDPAKAARVSTFEVTERIIDPAPWRSQI